jgi:pimeloyl-ACP methyl ester carboxylesterase
MSLSRKPVTASISERESGEIKAANASENTPVVFVHGLWLLPSSWASWAGFFGRAGYAPLAPDWPDDPETVDQARANEARQLYEEFHVAGSGVSLVPMGSANLNPWTQAKVNTTNPGRGPLLIIGGEQDHTVPWAIAHAACQRQRRNPGVTQIVTMAGRGHSLTIDHGWREVAQAALDFVNRFA